MAKLSTKGLVVIALLLSFVTSVLVYNYLKGVSTKNTEGSTAVVVAKVDIPPKTKITPDMVQQVQTPPEFMQPGAIQDLGKAVGVVTHEKIVAGEQVTERHLLLEGKSAGFTGIIPPGKRAMTVAVTDVTGVAGLIKVGDYVDVVATFDQSVAGDYVGHNVLQNIQVLAINKENEAGNADTNTTDKKDAIKSTTVTLAVAPDEAARLALSEDKGKVFMALRPYLAASSYVPTNPVTPKDLVGVLTQHNSGVGSTGETKPSSPASPPAQTRPSKPGRENPYTESGIMVIRGSKVETIPIN